MVDPEIATRIYLKGKYNSLCRHDLDYALYRPENLIVVLDL
jgi:hypothetical protein